MKKVLISSDSGLAHYYIRVGIGKVFSYMGYDVTLWDINKKPATDAFDEIEPDIFIGQTYNATRPVLNAIRERPHLKVVMKAGDYNTETWIDYNKYPILKVSPEEVQNIFNLFTETGRPNYLQVHYHPDYINKTHGMWQLLGIPVFSQMNAADVFAYTKGQKQEKFESDLAYIGGYWQYKSININKFFLPIINMKKYRIKIFGNQPWPFSEYCGFLEENYVKHVLKSAKICPNFHEPHSIEYGFDVIERPFKLLSNKCFVISDYVSGLARLFQDKKDMVFANNPDEFLNAVEYYIDREKDREEIAENGYQTVLSEHTYFHRVRDMLNRFGMTNEAERCMDCYKRLKKEAKL